MITRHAWKDRSAWNASGISQHSAGRRKRRLLSRWKQGDVVVAAIRTAEREEEGTQAPVATAPDRTTRRANPKRHPGE
jgi:hypothetical protein